MNRRAFTKRNQDKEYQPIILVASAIPKVTKKWSGNLQTLFTIQEVNGWERLKWSLTNQSPSVLLLDLDMLQPDGMGSIFDLQRMSPSTKIILLTNMYNEKEAVSAFKAGAKGYGNKDMVPSLLKKAVEVVQKGEVWVGRKTISYLLSELTLQTKSLKKDQPNLSEVCLDYLTRREYQIAKMVGDGASNKEIAQRLNISERTVKAHLTAVFNKLEIPDRLRLGLFITNYNLQKEAGSS